MSSLTFQADAVADGGMKTFEHGEKKVLIVREGSDYRAFDALCPHAGADLADGALCEGRLVCPWHHASFDARSGALLEPLATEPLTRYPVHRQSDSSFSVDVDHPMQRPEPEPLRPGEHVVIVGAGGGGFMAAHTLRERGFAGTITLLDPERAAPYERPTLSKQFLAGTMQADELGLGGDDWATKRRIERLYARATGIDTDGRRLLVEGGDPLAYDHLIIATGSEPKTANLEGADLDGVLTLRSLADAKALREAAKNQRVVIIGSSFIGMEAAASLTAADTATSVSVVSKDDEVMQPMLSPAVARELRRLHESKGVTFHLGSSIKRLTGSGTVSRVELDNGTRLDADVVLLGVGVSPRSQLLEAFADEHGAVAVDAQMRVREHLYAVGDIAQAPTVLGPLRIEHWRVAMQHGMVAALSILGEPEGRMDQRVPFFWSGQFGEGLRYVGHGAADAPRHVWGDPAELKFIEFSFDGQRTVAAVGMHREKDLAAFELLLKMDRAPTADEIRAGQFDLTARLSGTSLPSGQD